MKKNFRKPHFDKKPSPVRPPRTKGPSPIPTRAPGEFPMRINKYLSWKGYATRQGADELIKKKAVTVNGRIAELGQQVQESDTVEVRSHRSADAFIYYAYNKPRGMATEPGTLPVTGVFPVGTLGEQAEGLIILTNDGRIMSRLQNPEHAHPREYVIRTTAPVKPSFKEKMEAGVSIDGAAPIHCKINMMNESLFNLRISDHESQIRQMCSMFFAEIESMTRTQVMNVKLGRLAPNSYRRIEGDELNEFLRGLGL